MEQHCIRHDQLPGASRLFADLLYHYDRVSHLYHHAPYDPDSYLAAAKEIVYPADRRAAIVAANRSSLLISPPSSTADHSSAVKTAFNLLAVSPA